MKSRPDHISALLFLIAIALFTPVMAQISTGYPEFKITNQPIIIDEQDPQRYSQLGDMLYRLHLHSKNVYRANLEAGKLDIHTYTYGSSQCQQLGLAGRLASHLLPFQTDTTRTLAFEGFSHIIYQWPGVMHPNLVKIRANQQRLGRNVMKELFQAMLPMYAMSRKKDDGSNKSFVLPFYDAGLNLYRFSFDSISDSLISKLQEEGVNCNPTKICSIHFEPIHQHHTLLSGYVVIDSTNMQVLNLCCDGRIDLATFHGDIRFSHDTLSPEGLKPISSDLDIHYKYLKTHSTNSYHTLFKYIEYVPLDSLLTKEVPLDLTEFYQEEPMLQEDINALRPITLPSDIDSLLNVKSSHTRIKRQKNAFETVSESLFDGTHVGTEENLLRIYGPLDPASLGYDGLNGITILEKARYNRRFSNQQFLSARAEAGYAFGLREIRYKLNAQWTYNPNRRGTLRLETSKRNSTFSSKFINTINEALKKEKANFDSLGIDYYRRYELDLRHSIELRNGLMFHLGILGTYRDPVKRGNRRPSAEHLKSLVDSYYADFAPYMRFEWTPRQYYWYNQGYKEYIPSPAPTFAFEFARALPGLFGTDSNYGRVEFDMEQSIRLNRTRTLAYHVGCGKFFNQRGEYFINYRYFSRSMYPESWTDDRIGGTFHLLDDIWYSSSPSYVQAHVMHETPFGLCHQLSRISHFVIKERVYGGMLFAEGKNLFTELGYGIDNNYYNVGFFVGFKDVNFYKFGVKFRIEIGRHI